jgi:CBS domain containing-hemolysin-like protein
MGRVPQGGETLRVDGLLLTIEQVSGRRIRRVRVCRDSAE